MKVNSALCSPVLFLALGLKIFPNLALPAAEPSRSSSRPPNIILLLADDMRPDCIGALGHPVIQTPHLDSLARGGTVFTRAIAAYPICHVSRAEMLSGTSAFRNGVQYRGTTIDPSLALWARTLQQAGYRTWFTGKWHNDGQPKTRGYEETRGLFSSGGSRGEKEKPYLDHRGQEATGYRGWTFKRDDGKAELEKGVGLTALTSRHMGDAAVELIQRKPDKPFFLQVSFAAPHDPLIFPPGYEKKYDPAKIPLPKNFLPEHLFDHGNLKGRDEQLWPWPRTPADVRSELAAYYAIISDMDAQIGRLLAALQATGQADNTVIIFSSDQGLAIGSHGLRGKQNMYEHTVGVPLILAGPGVPRGRRLDAQCYLRDLFPTTCEMARVAIPPTVQGRSLVPVLNGKAEEIYPFVVAYFTDTQRMIREGSWKLVFYPKLAHHQLFDLTNDPDEITDLSGAARHAARMADLKKKLETWLKENGDPLFAK
ncbi:MAG: sulfatase-like hydrolase/transferase [Verrucomicrobia bacterium]|nr:sulfatase-like hydrolase/transferase [Verrucomicrobiota bacterium]